MLPLPESLCALGLPDWKVRVAVNRCGRSLPLASKQDLRIVGDFLVTNMDQPDSFWADDGSVPAGMHGGGAAAGGVEEGVPPGSHPTGRCAHGAACPAFQRLVSHGTAQADYDHCCALKHPQTLCRYGAECRAFCRLSQGGFRIDDLCHAVVYAHQRQTHFSSELLTMTSSLLAKKCEASASVYAGVSLCPCSGIHYDNLKCSKYYGFWGEQGDTYAACQLTGFGHGGELRDAAFYTAELQRPGSVLLRSAEVTATSQSNQVLSITLLPTEGISSAGGGPEPMAPRKTWTFSAMAHLRTALGPMAADLPFTDPSASQNKMKQALTKWLCAVIGRARRDGASWLAFCAASKAALALEEIDQLELEVASNGFAHVLTPTSGDFAHLRDVALAKERMPENNGINQADILAILIYTGTDVQGEFRMDMLRDGTAWPMLCSVMTRGLRTQAKGALIDHDSGEATPSEGLFHGLHGIAIKDFTQFIQSDQGNHIAITIPAVVSASRNRSTAIAFACGKGGTADALHKHGLLLEITCHNEVAADVSWISKFPGEEETCFAPFQTFFPFGEQYFWKGEHGLLRDMDGQGFEPLAETEAEAVAKLHEKVRYEKHDGVTIQVVSVDCVSLYMG